MGSFRSRVVILSLVLCGINCFTIRPDPSTTTALPATAPDDDKVTSASYVSDPVMAIQDVMQRTRQSDDCIVLNITESLLGLHEIKEVRDKSLTFFIRPKPSFRKLVFRIKLKHVLDLSDAFFSEKAIDLHRSDLLLSESQPWTRVDVDYFQNPSRGPNYHALRVTVGNTSLQLVTKNWWVLHRYEGFAIYAEGGAQIFFNCPLKVLQEIPIEALSSSGIWLMVGLLTAVLILLGVLFCVWVSIRCRRKSQSAPTPPLSPVYEEFDEEVLEKIRLKVETLRSGKSMSDLKCTGNVSFEPDRENPYVSCVTLMKGSERSEENLREERHLYENAYYERPTPAARFTGETPLAEGQIPNPEEPHEDLPCVIISPGEVGEEALVERTSKESTREGSPYENMSTLLNSQGQSVETDS